MRKTKCRLAFERFMRNNFHSNDFTLDKETHVYIDDFIYFLYLAYDSAWRCAKSRVKQGKEI